MPSLLLILIANHNLRHLKAPIGNRRVSSDNAFTGVLPLGVATFLLMVLTC